MKHNLSIVTKDSVNFHLCSIKFEHNLVKFRFYSVFKVYVYMVLLKSV